MSMTPGWRRFFLTAHVASSVGWLGAVAAFLALAVLGMEGRETESVRAAFWAMEATARWVIVPLAVGSLLTGILQSMATPWGLLRHYWVVVKLLLTVFATVVLLAKVPLIYAAAGLAAEDRQPSAELRAAGAELLVHSAGGVLVLLATVALSVYKPRGLTPYGRRERSRGHMVEEGSTAR